MPTHSTNGRSAHEPYLAAIVGSAGDAIIGVGLDGVVQTWNAGAQRLFGYAAPEIAGRNIALLELAERPSEIAGIMARAASGETVRNYRALRRGKDGAWIHLSVTVSPVRDESGRILGISAIVRDIAERAALEDALRLSEQRYRSLALASAQIVWTKSPDGGMIEDSRLWRAFTGQTAAEIAGRGWAAAVHPDDRERIAEVFAHARQTGTVYETEYRLRRHDGEYRYMAVRGVPVLETGGHVREWIGSCADITERKHAEAEARQSQRELALKTRFASMFLTLPEQEIFAAVLDAVLENTQSAEGIFGYLDDDGSMVFPMWGWDQRAVPGETVRFRREEWAGIWGRALLEKRSVYSNVTPLEPAPINRALAVPIFFQNEPIGIFAIANKATDYGEEDRVTLERLARDIAPVFKARLQRDAQERARQRAEAEVRTINAELERRVQERTAQLEAANGELEAFSYSVSHDLRAPLRAINGFSRILIEEYAPQVPDMARHYLEVVHDNALQMGELIDDLLALSRLGRQALQKQPVVPAELVSQALHELRQETGTALQIDVKSLPACSGDPALLRQVFVNLLSNAIKYSGRRSAPRIEVGALPPVDGHAVVYYVRDNGVGFDMRYVHKLFGVFQRLHSAGEYPGTGIGLATVKRILHRHGGRIWAESEIDRGATFYFTMEPET